MPLHARHTVQSLDDTVYASSDLAKASPKYRFPPAEWATADALAVVTDELMLDGNARQNLATFCQTWEEPAVHALMDLSIDKNMIDKDEYPQTAELERRCVHMLADLWNAPPATDVVGASTIGSSEACMLGGLAAKWRWRSARRAAGLPTDRPNMVCGPVQVVWHKFARYWDIEMREVPMAPGHYAMDVDDMLARVDENTIMVVPTFGVTYTGAYEAVAEMAAALDDLEARTGLDIDIHVDAASGGFLAPFCAPDVVWDFRLPRVKSISSSGHKFGLAPLGVGWIVWRDVAELPDDLIFHVSYLGGDMPVFQLNFSRPAGQIVAQYYDFVRLGRQGYQRVHTASYDVGRHLAAEIAGLGPFELLAASDPARRHPGGRLEAGRRRGARLHALRRRRPTADPRLAGPCLPAHRRREGHHGAAHPGAPGRQPGPRRPPPRRSRRGDPPLRQAPDHGPDVGPGSVRVQPHMSERVFERATSGAVPPHRTLAERVAAGRRARNLAPRSAHGLWTPVAGRDPLAVLAAQGRTRIPELMPIRMGRMAASEFAFYRGAAAVMAADLAPAPRTGLQVQLCGDAHLVNFGAFAAPDRRLVFSVNDFDETLPGPFEWDVKRLVASFAVVGLERGLSAARREAIVAAVSRSYCEAMREFAAMGSMAVWYARLDARQLIERWGALAGTKEIRALEQTIAQARAKDSLRAMTRLTEVAGGERRFVSRPPLVVRLADLIGGAAADHVIGDTDRLLGSYLATLSSDRRALMARFRVVDLARKVVGVGSVGTRDWIALLLGRDGDDPLLLQFKEAEASVLEPYLGPCVYDNHGQRVVEGQRLMQAASDVLLGWQRSSRLDGTTRHYYVRQLWDDKGTADVGALTQHGLTLYGSFCGWTLARAHARSGDPVAIDAYLGVSDTFDRAMIVFAETYAAESARDHNALRRAIAAGRVEAVAGV